MTNFFEYIDEYKAGSLTSELQLAFEEELKVNPKLKHAVENYDLLKKISASLIEDETRELLKEIKGKGHYSSNDINKKGPLRILPINRKWMAIAASFFTIIISLFLIFSNLSTPGEEEYFAEAHNLLDQDPISQVVRGGNDSNTKELNRAISLYYDKQFDVAKPLFEINFQSDSLNTIADYYLAHIYIKNKEYAKATTKFESLANHETYGFLAKYRLVLCYYLQKDKKKAQYYFDQIKDSRFMNEKDKEKLQSFLQ